MTAADVLGLLPLGVAKSSAGMGGEESATATGGAEVPAECLAESKKISSAGSSDANSSQPSAMFKMLA